MFWALDLVRDQATREPLVPYRAGTATLPMAELVAACKERGMLPFANFNRLHVVPPCTITEDGGQGRPRRPRRGPHHRRRPHHFRLAAALTGHHARDPHLT